MKKYVVVNHVNMPNMHNNHTNTTNYTNPVYYQQINQNPKIKKTTSMCKKTVMTKIICIILAVILVTIICFSLYVWYQWYTRSEYTQKGIYIKEQLILRGCYVDVESLYEIINCIKNVLKISNIRPKVLTTLEKFAKSNYDDIKVKKLINILETAIKNSCPNANMYSEEYSQSLIMHNKNRWHVNTITWCYIDNDINVKNINVNNLIQLAVDKWNVASNLNIKKANNIENCNIKIYIASKFHKYHNSGRNCIFKQNELGHASNNYIVKVFTTINSSEIHINSDFKNKTVLYNTIIHEIGHSLGLDHTDNMNAVMYAYTGKLIDKNSPLPLEDVKKLQKLYGKPSKNKRKHKKTKTITTTTNPIITTTTDYTILNSSHYWYVNNELLYSNTFSHKVVWNDTTQRMVLKDKTVLSTIYHEFLATIYGHDYLIKLQPIAPVEIINSKSDCEVIDTIYDDFDVCK